MKFKSYLRGIFLLGGLVSPIYIGVSVAQTTPIPAATTPTVFDQTEVLRLIDDIENPMSARKLTGYLLSDRLGVLTQNKGFQLLVTAISQEKVGTKKWLLSQQLLGKVGLKRNWLGQERKQAFRAYDEVFAQQELLMRTGKGPLLGEVIADFTELIADPNAGSEFHGLEKEAELLFPKAFDAHLALLRRGIYTSLKVSWLIAVMGYPKPLLKEWAESASVDPANKNSFGILRFAALVHEPLRPEQALPILEKIKPLVAQQEKDQKLWYYRSLVSVLERLGKTPEAMNEAREVINVTSSGRDLLLRLLLKSGELDSIPALIEEYKAANINDEDVQPLIGVFWSSNLEQKTLPLRSKWGEEVLASYLSSNKNRDIESDLLTRSYLASKYKKSGRIEEARALLEDGLKQPEPTLARTLLLYRKLKYELDRLNTPSATQ